jgi:hypothetical protein
MRAGAAQDSKLRSQVSDDLSQVVDGGVEGLHATWSPNCANTCRTIEDRVCSSIGKM